MVRRPIIQILRQVSRLWQLFLARIDYTEFIPIIQSPRARVYKPLVKRRHYREPNRLFVCPRARNCHNLYRLIYLLCQCLLSPFLTYTLFTYHVVIFTPAYTYLLLCTLPITSATDLPVTHQNMQIYMYTLAGLGSNTIPVVLIYVLMS